MDGSRSSVETALLRWKQFAIILAAIYLPLVTSPAQPGTVDSNPQVYWGGYLDGENYGQSDAPWGTRTIELFEDHAGKGVSILHWGQFWHWSGQSGYAGIADGHFQPFETAMYERVRQHGAIPMIDWNSWSGDAGGSADQPDYQLQRIIQGDYDTYIHRWARDARSWGKPFFLRFDHEMNGEWFPWSERANGNQTGEYVQMWRHVHDIFEKEGTSNVTWVWSANIVYDKTSGDLAALYPGDDYVDWVAIDGYNQGTHPNSTDEWKTFSEVFGETYEILGETAPDKPVMLSEFSSTEYGGSKADWISDALSEQIPDHFPRIKAVVWFNWNCDGWDWVIESSTSAQEAFASGIGSSYYAANDYADLPAGKVQPLISVKPGEAGASASP